VDPPEGGVTVTDEERLARLALARIAEPGSHAVHEALQKHAATEVWAAVKAGAPLGQLGQRVLEGVASRLDGYAPERDLERLGDLGGRVVCPGDDEWPARLEWATGAMTGDVKEMAPPWVLLVRGSRHLRQALADSVAIVGARAATSYGTHVAGEMAFALAEAGITVVSGAAYGIDGAAHRGALAAQVAPTVAVLACGLDTAYPRGNDRLLAQVADSGLVISEVPPGCSPTRVRFLVRNRIVAAMTRGTVVVEAALRSGSLSTAQRAVDLGRPVMAVPGPVTSPQSSGCHQWIRDGKAVLVTDAAEVLDLSGAAGQHLLSPKRGAAHPRDGLDETVRRVLDAVPVRVPVGVARIARTGGVSALVVQQVLPSLLVAGLVEQRDGAWRLTALGAGKPAKGERPQ
jgi:DNA processing protein